VAAIAQAAGAKPDKSASAGPAIGWLYSSTTDLFILLAPIAITAGCAVLEASRGGGRVLERDYAGWISQFVLGNTSHVILTFLLLFVRRDMLDAAPNQRRIVVGGGLVALVASFGFLWTFARVLPTWGDFGTAIVVIFASHHSLSQTKGIWSLYALRAGGLGLPRPAPAEQKLQRAFVPVGLVLLVTRILFVPADVGRRFSLVVPIPGEAALLPFEAAWLLVAAWVGFAGTIVWTMVRGRASVARVVYVALHALAIAVTLRWPTWGTAISAGMHGLEYYFLSARMIGPAEGESSRVRGAWVWVCMAVAMAPAFVVGAMIAPFKGTFALSTSAQDAVEIARLALNAVVLTHYFADAFIYRFRIPSVRQVALRRLHFV